MPEQSLIADVTHVALAFILSGALNEVEPLTWDLFDTVANVRSKFAPGTAVIIAIGGWVDDGGFSVAAATEGSRRLFAQNVTKLVDETGADGRCINSIVCNNLLNLLRCRC